LSLTVTLAGHDAYILVFDLTTALIQLPDCHERRLHHVQRLEASDAGPNLKTGPGGTYDLDFLTGRLQAEHAAWSSDNLAARIALLEKDGRLHSDDARELSANATFLRNLEHCVRLVTGRPDKWLPVGDHARAAADRLMAVCECPAPGSDLEQTLSTTLCRNREICLKYLFD